MNMIELSVLNGIMIGWFATAIVYLFASSIYEIQFAAIQQRQQHARSKRLTKQVHITILVYINECAEGLYECLKSVRSNRYKYYDVVVVDNSQSKRVRSIIRAISNENIKFPICIYTTRKPMKQSEALLNGFNRSHKGDLICVISPANKILPRTLRQLAVLFSYETADIVRLPVVYKGLLTIETAIWSIRDASTHLFRKVDALVLRPINYNQILSHVLRRDVFIKRESLPVVYVTDMPIEYLYLIKSHHVNRLMYIAIFFLQLAVLGVLGIVVMLAVYTGISQPFIQSLMLVSFWTFTVILLADNIYGRKKLYLLASTFISIFIYTAVTIMCIPKTTYVLFKPVIRKFQ